MDFDFVFYVADKIYPNLWKLVGFAMLFALMVAQAEKIDSKNPKRQKRRVVDFCRWCGQALNGNAFCPSCNGPQEQHR